MKEIIFNPLLKMTDVYRYSGKRLVQQESTMEHTAAVGILSILTGNSLNKVLEKAGLEERVDLASVSLKALAHDIDEHGTCDVPRNVKYHNKVIKTELDNMGKSVVKSFSDKFNFPELYDIWESSKDDTLEGQTVKVCDMLHVVHKVIQEVEILNNKNMLIVAIELVDHLETSQSKWRKTNKFNPIIREFFLEIFDDCLGLIQFVIRKHQNEITNYYLEPAV